jgi:hypothetical protein
MPVHPHGVLSTNAALHGHSPAPSHCATQCFPNICGATLSVFVRHRPPAVQPPLSGTGMLKAIPRTVVRRFLSTRQLHLLKHSVAAT